jgi:hypothetical protein
MKSQKSSQNGGARGRAVRRGAVRCAPVVVQGLDGWEDCRKLLIRQAWGPWRMEPASGGGVGAVAATA